MKEIKTEVKNGIITLIYKLGNLKKNEKLCVISDKNTSNLGELFFEVAKHKNSLVEHHIMNEMKIHGEEPPKEILKHMKDSNLIIGLTSFSMSHSKARYKAELMGNRYLSLADYSLDVLSHISLQENFIEKGEKAKLLANNKECKILERIK